MKPGKCRDCGREFFWLKSDGKSMPVNKVSGVYVHEKVVTLTSIEDIGKRYSGPYWVAHWEVCPKAQTASWKEKG